MSTRSRRLPAVAATFALVVTGLAISQPTTARAATCDSDNTPPTISGYAPTSVTLGVNSKLVQFSIKASDPCGIEGWTLDTPDKLLFFVYDGSP